MKDAVFIFKNRLYFFKIADVGFNEFRLRIKVFFFPCSEVVNDRDPMARLNEGIYKIGTDKSGAAGYEVMFCHIKLNLKKKKNVLCPQQDAMLLNSFVLLTL